MMKRCINCFAVVILLISVMSAYKAHAQQFDYEWPDVMQTPNNVPQPKVEVEKSKKDVSPILLNEINAVESQLNKSDKNEDQPLAAVIDDKPSLRDKKADSKKFKVRQVYDYRNKEMPKFFQNAEYINKNKHLPKVFYQAGYSKLLFDAVDQKNIGAINTLIERGADINAKDAKSGITPLIRAVEINSESVVRYLVVRGADINAYNLDHKTPMHIAAQNDLMGLFNIMVKNGGDPYAHDKEGKSALDYLTADARAEYIISRLRTQSEKDAALLDFAREGHLDAAKKVITLGANVNTKDSQGESPLIIAVHNHDINMASLLLFYGANPTIRNNARHDAYAYAARSGDQSLVNIVDTYIIKQELDTGVPYQRAVIHHDAPKKEAPVYDAPVVGKSEDAMVIEPIYQKKLDTQVIEENHNTQPSKPKSIIPVHLH